MQTTYTITIPLPHGSLSPNSRSHWRALAKAKKLYRTRAMLGARAAMLCREPRWKSAKTSIRWFTKTARHPDPDNALASLKAAFDGFRDAGLIDDDNGLAHDRIVFAKDAKDPRVEITVEGTDDPRG